MKLPQRIAIIGAGASGLFMAERLYKLAENQNQNIKITLFEKESRVGGKCYSFQSQTEKNLITELGAGAVAANYGLVIDAMKEHQIEFEYMLPAAEEGLELAHLFQNASWGEKLGLSRKLLTELKQFDNEYLIYLQAKESRQPIPAYLKASFNSLCERYGWQYLPLLEEPLVPGFGYGDLRQIPAYSVLEYMGRSTLLSIILNDKLLNRPKLLAIKGGFQSLLEQMSKKHDLRTGVHIHAIQRLRNANHEVQQINIHYNDPENKERVEEHFDCLVLANSPYHWNSLGMDLTEVEQECVKHFTSYRYPVAAVKIKGLMNQQYFFPEAMRHEGFGHVALITTRDNRPNPEDGRLCTIYINQNPGENHFSFQASWNSIVSDLKKIDGVEDVELVKEQYWPDYLPSLPWELRLKLEKEQYAEHNKSLYLGAYTLGAFEDVCSVANKAANLANQLFSNNTQPQERFSTQELPRASFFYGSAYRPVENGEEQRKEMEGCNIL